MELNQHALKGSKNGGTYASDGDRRIPEVEELVHAGDEDGPGEADNPCPDGVHGHVGIIGVRDGGPHLGVGGILL